MILTDINMPEMDGFQMSEAIHKLVREHSDERVLIYAVTAMNDLQIKNRHQKYGITEVLSKPVRTEILAPIFEAIFNLDICDD